MENKKRAFELNEEEHENLKNLVENKEVQRPEHFWS